MLYLNKTIHQLAPRDINAKAYDILKKEIQIVHVLGSTIY